MTAPIRIETEAGAQEKADAAQAAAIAHADSVGLGSSAAVTAEASARASADTALSTAITSEASTRGTAITTETAARTAGDALAAQKSANLSDLANAATARGNLGLGTASTHAATDFEPAGTTTAAVTALVGGAPGALDTLNEIATALNDDANLAGTLTTSIATKQIALTPTTVKTSAYTAAANELVKVDATSSTVLITLPTAPPDKTLIGIKKLDAVNQVTYATGGSDVLNKAGGVTSGPLTLLSQAVLLEYEAATHIWTVIAGDIPLTQLKAYLQPSVYYPEDYGAKGDEIVRSDGAITSGSPNLTSATGTFTTADVGKHIRVEGAGASGAALVTTILSVQSTTAITLAANAGTTVSGKYYAYATDDTAAFQAAIDAMATAGNGVLQCGSKTYLLDSAPRHDRGGNAVVALPVATVNGMISLTIRGVSSQQLDNFPVTRSGTYFHTYRTGLSYSGSFGAPSMFGGPTTESSGMQSFSFCHVNVENVVVWLPGNPTMAGIDLSHMVNASVRNSQVVARDLGSADWTQPMSTHAFGVAMPTAGNYGVALLDGALCAGVYVGCVFNSEHTDFRHFIAKWCYMALGVDPTNISNHPSVGHNMQPQWCCYMIGGWAPATGIGNLASTTWVDFSGFDIEDGPTAGGAKWYDIIEHIHDPTNLLYGIIKFVHSQNSSPFIGGFSLTVNGASFCDLIDLQANQGSIGAQYRISCIAPPMAGGSSWSVAMGASTISGYGLPAAFPPGGTGAAVEWLVPKLVGGTYSIMVLRYGGTSTGIYEIRIDGVAVGTTIDTYLASPVGTIRDLQTGIVIKGGSRRVGIHVTGKNASSSAAQVYLTEIILIRTA